MRTITRCASKARASNKMNEKLQKEILETLERIAAALERQEGYNTLLTPEWESANSWVWQPEDHYLKPAGDGKKLPLEMLVGLDQQTAILLQNTRQFAEGYSANNALLWGARGMGKSSLVKAVHSRVIEETGTPLILIEVFREDIKTIPDLLDIIKPSKGGRFILFCDDLSFAEGDMEYKSLKVILEGGVEERPENVLFYATSNRRHLMPRQMMENERSTAINPAEAIEETVSLSDRFGLWLGFHPCSQDEYLAMIDNYATDIDLPVEKEELHREALEWAQTRGARSGRVAMQFIRHMAGRYKIRNCP